MAAVNQLTVRCMHAGKGFVAASAYDSCVTKVYGRVFADVRSFFKNLPELANRLICSASLSRLHSMKSSALTHREPTACVSAILGFGGLQRKLEYSTDLQYNMD